MNQFELRLNTSPFESIKHGTKTIEMRLLDEKRKQYKIGDILVFKKRPDETEVLRAKIVNLYLFKNFSELYSKFDKVKLGYKENEVARPEDMQEYYSIEEQNKYGVIGIEIKLI